MITKILLSAALKLTQSRPPDFAVGSEDSPYMLRWFWIPRNKFFNVYVHMFLCDDDDRALHDHPWASLSLLCRGTILEHFQEPDKTGLSTRHISPGQWTYRSASFAHRLSIPEQAYEPVTIFITGPRFRQWGFHCPKGWKHWKDFVGTKPGTVGIGCGEQE